MRILASALAADVAWTEVNSAVPASAVVVCVRNLLRVMFMLFLSFLGAFYLHFPHKLASGSIRRG